MIREGTQAPEFTLDQVEGKPISLRDVLDQDCNVLLIFLRYLG